MKDHELRKALGYKDEIYMFQKQAVGGVIENLQAQIEFLRNIIYNYFRECSYCKKFTPKDKLYFTEEKIQQQPCYNPSYLPTKLYACDNCLKDFKNKCKLAKEGLKNKAMKGKENGTK